MGYFEAERDTFQFILHSRARSNTWATLDNIFDNCGCEIPDLGQ